MDEIVPVHSWKRKVVTQDGRGDETELPAEPEACWEWGAQGPLIHQTETELFP